VVLETTVFEINLNEGLLNQKHLAFLDYDEPAYAVY
jgi:hypothetical protein